MKKVGLITYYGDNYGGVLQAYALEKLVMANGFDCELISNDFLYRGNKAKKRKAKLNNLLAAIRDPFEYISKRGVYKKYAGQQALRAEKFSLFRRKHLRINQTGYTCYDDYLTAPPRYDVYLCGSDQIWNPNLYSDNGFYFAGFAPENAVKISYASSIGVSTVDQRQARFMAPLLNRLDVISTREQKGARIIDTISEKTATVVLDPTLLLEAEDWAAVAAPRLIEEPYVFCYLFGERDYVAEVKKQIRAITGLKIVSIPMVSRELSSGDEKIFDAGPAEFISLIQNAALVLTDSFHATAFSINLKTPFLSLCRFAPSDQKGMNDRLVTLLSLVGLQERLVDAKDPVSEVLRKDIDFENAHGLLGQKRQQNRQFLTNALNYSKA